MGRRRGARARPGQARGRDPRGARRLRQEETERVEELRESLEARVEYLSSGEQTGFADEDHLWADSLDVNVKKLVRRRAREAPQGPAEDVRRPTSTTPRPTSRTPRERLREVWELFANKDEPSDEPPQEGEEWPLSTYTDKPIEKDEFRPKTIIADETLFRELKDRFGSPYGFGEYFRGGMGAESIRDLLREKPSTTAAAARGRPGPPGRHDLAPQDLPGIVLEHEREDLEDQVKNGKGQKQARAVKRLKVVSAFLHSEQQARA